jgi:hypothetical protein
MPPIGPAGRRAGRRLLADLPTPAGSGAGPGLGQPAGPPDREANLTGLSGEAAGLFAATDSLVDAIDTAAEILGHPEQVR